MTQTRPYIIAASPSAASLCRAIAAAVFRQPGAALDDPAPKCRKSARPRQLAIYLQHVALGAGIGACAALYRRDRSTIRHACARIEDAREDVAFDAALAGLEAALRQQCAALSDLADMLQKEEPICEK